jgi:hypothetical protein
MKNRGEGGPPSQNDSRFTDYGRTKVQELKTENYFPIACTTASCSAGRTC